MALSFRTLGLFVLVLFATMRCSDAGTDEEKVLSRRERHGLQSTSIFSDLPSSQPSSHPSSQPSKQPTRIPSRQPTSQPSRQPSGQPSKQPTRLPTSQPTRIPTRQPTSQPSRQPISRPTQTPTSQPTMKPSTQPSNQPTSQPSIVPTSQPSEQPTRQPTRHPSGQPTRRPTRRPTSQPSRQPSRQPTGQPTRQPSRQPTSRPSSSPSTSMPSQYHTNTPTDFMPTSFPTSVPSSVPTSTPTSIPSSLPSMQPSSQPSREPSLQPSRTPTRQPSRQPTRIPSRQPTSQPSRQPSGQPSRQPSRQPTGQPSRQPSRQPTMQPSRQPSGQPTMQPSSQPVGRPTSQPSRQPTSRPSRQPTSQPSRQPSRQPSMQPSSQPSSVPTHPSSQPSGKPSKQPSSNPSGQPSQQPSVQPSSQPSSQPSAQPSRQPSMQPSSQPLYHPSSQPSTQPSAQPSKQPSRQPSSQPSHQPSFQPSSQPTKQPSSHPTSPSGQPSRQPSSQPSKQPTSRPSTIFQQRAVIPVSFYFAGLSSQADFANDTAALTLLIDSVAHALSIESDYVVLSGYNKIADTSSLSQRRRRSTSALQVSLSVSVPIPSKRTSPTSVLSNVTATLSSPKFASTLSTSMQLGSALFSNGTSSNGGGGKKAAALFTLATGSAAIVSKSVSVVVTHSALPSSHPTSQPTSSPSAFCRPGAYVDGIVCPQCAAGKFSNVSFAPSCTLCSPGKAAVAAGSSQCTLCLQGFYESAFGASECTQCPPSRTTPALGATSDQQCVNPSMNFALGGALLGVVALMSFFYIIAGRFEQVARWRRTRVTHKLAQKYLAMTNTLYRKTIVANVERMHEKAELQKEKRVGGGIFNTLLFILLSLVISALTTVIVYVSIMSSVFFQSLILFKAHLNVRIEVPFTTKLEQAIKQLGGDFMYLFLPFTSLLSFLSGLKIDLSAVNVTCLGATSPFELFFDIIILGAVVIVIQSKYQLFQVTFKGLIASLTNFMLLPSYGKLLAKEKRESNQGWFSFWFDPAKFMYFAYIVTQFPAQNDVFQIFLSFSMSFVNIKSFWANQGYWHLFSPACDSVIPFNPPILGIGGIDGFLALMSTFIFYALLLPVLYELVKVLTPGFQTSFLGPGTLFGIACAKLRIGNVEFKSKTLLALEEKLAIKERLEEEAEAAREKAAEMATTPSVSSVLRLLVSFLFSPDLWFVSLAFRCVKSIREHLPLYIFTEGKRPKEAKEPFNIGELWDWLCSFFSDQDQNELFELALEWLKQALVWLFCHSLFAILTWIYHTLRHLFGWLAWILGTIFKLLARIFELSLRLLKLFARVVSLDIFKKVHVDRTISDKEKVEMEEEEEELKKNKHIEEKYKKQELPSYFQLCRYEHEDISKGLSCIFRGKIGKAIAFFLVFFGFGHVFSPTGRMVVLMILNKLLIFGQICLGIWTQEAVEAYNVVGEIGRFSFYKREYEKVPRDSMKKSKSGKVANGGAEQHQGKDNDKGKEEASDFSLDDKFKMSVDYSNLLRSIVLARGVLLQLMPELTVASTFAYFISAAPVLIMSNELNDFMPPLLVSFAGNEGAFAIAKAQDEDCSWRGAFDPTKDMAAYAKLKELEGEIEANLVPDTSPQWSQSLNAIYIFCTQSRGYLFVLNLYKFSCTVGILYADPSIFMVLSFVIIMTFAFFRSFFFIVALGKRMDVRDEDLCFGYRRSRAADVVPLSEVVVATGGDMPFDASDDTTDPLHLSAAAASTAAVADTDLDADSEDIEDAILMVEAMVKEQKEAEAAGVVVRVDSDEDAKHDAGSVLDKMFSPEDLLELQLSFAKLKSFITGLVSAKKLRNWDNVKTVLASGQLSEATFTAALVKVGGDKPHAQLNFNQFLHVMILLEDELAFAEEGRDAEERGEEQEEEEEEEEEVEEEEEEEEVDEEEEEERKGGEQIAEVIRLVKAMVKEQKRALIRDANKVDELIM